LKTLRKTITIGIAGVSRAGKTELSKFLCKKFQAIGYNAVSIQLFDKKIFLEIRRSTFEKRRTEDNQWGFEPDWYIDHIWKSYEKYGKTILDSNSDFLKIYGENRSSYPAVWNYVVSDIKGNN